MFAQLIPLSILIFIDCSAQKDDFGLGYSNRAIAKRLNRHRSSIDRGLQRNTAGSGYKAEWAQDAYVTSRKKSKPKGKLADHLATIIADKLVAT